VDPTGARERAAYDGEIVLLLFRKRVSEEQEQEQEQETEADYLGAWWGRCTVFLAPRRTCVRADVLEKTAHLTMLTG
jgi:hypothetical protein